MPQRTRNRNVGMRKRSQEDQDIPPNFKRQRLASAPDLLTTPQKIGLLLPEMADLRAVLRDLREESIHHDEELIAVVNEFDIKDGKSLGCDRCLHLGVDQRCIQTRAVTRRDVPKEVIGNGITMVPHGERVAPVGPVFISHFRS